VYPASFEYFAPTKLDEVTEILGSYDGDAKVLAGGQSLIPMMKLRFAAPSALVDVNNVSELGTLTEENGGLRIGALTRHKAAEKSELLHGRFGVLGAAAPLISDPIVRNLGTVCGSLAHADPQGDWGSVMLAIGADLEVRGSEGARAIPIEEFFVAPFTTTLQPSEIVTAVVVRDPGQNAGGTYLKLERKVGDFATAGVAVHVSFSNGTVERAGIGLTGVGGTNIKATAAENVLAGAKLDDGTIKEAARLAAEAAEPQDDVRGTEEYKRNAIRVITARGLRKAGEVAA
jgi:carbon-monoxide dehydrogenase medium subunit